MDDSVRVPFRQRIGDLRGDVHGTTWIDRLSAHRRQQRFAGRVLGGQPHAAVILGQFVDRGDVRMRHGRCRLHVAAETREPFGIAGKRIGQHPEHDGAADVRIARPVRLAEIARADAFEDSVPLRDVIEHRTATIILTTARLSESPQIQSQLPPALHRPDRLATRRLVQRGGGVRAAARSHRFRHRRRVDADRAVPADGAHRPARRRGRRSRESAPGDDRERHPARIP